MLRRAIGRAYVRMSMVITLPDFNRAFDYENNFYLSCSNSRLGKFIIQYEIFKKIKDIPGAIVECGVFKGTSLMRFVGFRDLMEQRVPRFVVAFDTFAAFPDARFSKDKKPLEQFLADAGDQSISISQLREVLRRKGVNHGVDLVAGDINKTVPAFVKKHPRSRVALLHLDVDLYEPTVTILHYLYPLLVRGGILLLDDYGVFPGETKAVNEYFKGGLSIERFPFAKTPAWIVKR